jgi:hypothetical protein
MQNNIIIFAICLETLFTTGLHPNSLRFWQKSFSLFIAYIKEDLNLEPTEPTFIKLTHFKTVVSDSIKNYATKHSRQVCQGIRKIRNIKRAALADIAAFRIFPIDGKLNSHGLGKRDFCQTVAFFLCIITFEEAQRPSVACHMTMAEYEAKVVCKERTIITVRNHKTGDREEAMVCFQADDAVRLENMLEL